MIASLVLSGVYGVVHETGGNIFFGEVGPEPREVLLADGEFLHPVFYYLLLPMCGFAGIYTIDPGSARRFRDSLSSVTGGAEIQ